MAPRTHTTKASRGFAIFFAMLVASLCLAVGLAIYDLTVRELDLSATVSQSQYAIYAADTGAECALYWDLKCSLGGCRENSAFATSTAFQGINSGVLCNVQDIAQYGTPPTPFDAPPTGWSAWTRTVTATAATTSFYLSFRPQQPYCAWVEVAKSGSPTQTTIISHGYNTCDAGSMLRLERVLQVSY
jgi:hypothetical protein